MRKALFCIFTLFACVGVFAQQPVVAVAPFDAISGISATEASAITRVFFIRLGNAQKVSLVDRSVVERVLQEHRFQTGDWSNSQKTAELNKALNADWIVRGELEKFGSNILVTVQFYDIRTFRFMGGADVRIANADAAYDNMDPLVNKLIETIAGSSTKSSVITTEKTRRVPGIYPQFVKEAIMKIPEDELVGVGSAKMGTLSLSRTTAVTRAKEEIQLKMCIMTEIMRAANMVSSLEFSINETTLSKSSLPGSVIVADDAASDGTVWAVVRLGKNSVIQEINQVLVATGTQKTSFNVEARINEALARIYTEEVEVNDGAAPANMPRVEQPPRSGITQFVRDELKKVPEDMLVGVGSAKTDSLRFSRTLALLRARIEILAQIGIVYRDMNRDYTAGSGASTPVLDFSFSENFIASSLKLMIPSDSKEVFGVTPDGTVWAFVGLGKTSASAIQANWQRLMSGVR